MLLTIDVGNTNTVMGVFEGDKLDHSWRINTDARETADELALTFRGLLADLPGIEISLDALAARAAQLRKVELVAPRSPIGKNTVESLQSGILYGFAGQVDGMVRRLSAALAPQDPDSVHVIATGGLATLVIDQSETVTHYEPDLTLLGLRLIFERNT